MENKTKIFLGAISKGLKGLALVAALLVGAPASAFVLDFEAFGTGQIIDDEYFDSPPAGSTTVDISATNFGGGLNLAVVFDTDSPTGGDTDLRAPFISLDGGLDQAFEPGKVLIIQENGPCGDEFCDVPDDEGSRRAGEFEFIFGDVITLQTLDFFDIEVEENGDDPSGDNEIRLYDINDVEIFADTFFVPNTGGDRKWNQVDFGNVAGVKRMVVEMGGSGAIDNLTYVPIPGAVWLFISALGFLGWKGRGKATT